VGGHILGGNYYADYSESDDDGDGLGDTVYPILAGMDFDLLPLIGQQERVPEFPIGLATIYFCFRCSNDWNLHQYSL